MQKWENADISFNEHLIQQDFAAIGCDLLLLFSLSVMSESCDPMACIACQTPLMMGFSRQEYWSGLPFPSPRDLPNPGVEPVSPELAGGFFTTEPPGKPIRFD